MRTARGRVVGSDIPLEQFGESPSDGGCKMASSAGSEVLTVMEDPDAPVDPDESNWWERNGTSSGVQSGRLKKEREAAAAVAAAGGGADAGGSASGGPASGAGLGGGVALGGGTAAAAGGGAVADRAAVMAAADLRMAAAAAAAKEATAAVGGAGPKLVTGRRVLIGAPLGTPNQHTRLLKHPC